MLDLRSRLLSRRLGRNGLRRLPRREICDRRGFCVFCVRFRQLLCGGGRGLLFLRCGHLSAGHGRDGLFGLRGRRLLCCWGGGVHTVRGGHFCVDNERYELLNMPCRHLRGGRSERLFFLRCRSFRPIWRCRLRVLLARPVLGRWSCVVLYLRCGNVPVGVRGDGLLELRRGAVRSHCRRDCVLKLRRRNNLNPVWVAGLCELRCGELLGRWRRAVHHL